jgi:SsrA-binding protein
MSKKSDSELVSNRKASHNYEILETFESGIALEGTEVKSLRNHGGHLQDAYVVFSGFKPLLKNASISPYSFGNIHNHVEKRDRLLLLHKREILRLKEMSEKKGLALIPLSLYLKKGIVKVKIALAKGKKSYDKRDAAKEKEDRKSMERAFKNREE